MVPRNDADGAGAGLMTSTWEATYLNGVHHVQDGPEDSIGRLDFKQIRQIKLCMELPLEPGQTVNHQDVYLDVDPEKGEKAIRFRQVDYCIDTGKIHRVDDVLGIQKNVDGKAVKFFVFFRQDGSILISMKQDH